MSEEFLDEDGYPTDEALDKIATWHYDDPKGWFEFIRSLWFYADFGYWKEEQTESTQYHISTAGWSGNESIIKAMQLNEILWSFHWQQSRRGGHYIFEVK